MSWSILLLLQQEFKYYNAFACASQLCTCDTFKLLPGLILNCHICGLWRKTMCSNSAKNEICIYI